MDLDPDRLPDTGRAFVPDIVRFLVPVLFTAWLCQVAGIVLHSNSHDLVIPGTEGIRYLRRKRRLATLVLDDDFASGRHARIFRRDGSWFVEDLGSTNGTFLGANKLTTPMPVEVGSTLRIGKTVFELRK